jgi:L-lactate dehydrogenase complex protein LldG
VGRFETVIGKIRQGLNPGADAQPANHADPATPSIPLTPPVTPPTSDELRTRFVAALKAAGAQPIEVADEAGAAQQAAELLRALNLRSAVIAQGITTDSASVAARLSSDGYEVTRIGSHDGNAFTDFKQRMSVIDVGIVEADYAIASTGTLALVATPARPRSVSLIPPINIVLVRAARILSDLAAVLRAVGPETIASCPMVLVTGPSRTADIEKRIVIGVHGPKELYVVIIGDPNAADVNGTPH